MNILNRQEMYFFDKYTMGKIGIPSATLMENAGCGCSEYLRKNLLLPQANVLICCGNGNNGGDGFVIARYLKEGGYLPHIVLLGKPAKMSAETYENYQKCRALKIRIEEVNSVEEWQNLKLPAASYDYLIDAIFGIGFKGVVKGWRAKVIEDLNNLKALKIAIDIASGVDADTGAADIAINADYTLTLAAAKYGHFLLPGRIATGELKIIDIGIPERLYQQYPPQANLVTEDNVEFPYRSQFYHKGHYGRVGIIAGAPGFSGAAIMASRAALRAGGGLITLFHPAGMQQIFETQLVEVMTYEMPVWKEKIENSTGFEHFKEKLFTMDSLLIGPGIGVNSVTRKIMKFILENWDKPLVIDADGLNILAEKPQLLLKAKTKNILLTPHLGEFCRLIGRNKEELIDILQALQNFVKEYKVNVLLKSCTSIFANDNKLIFNTSGNDALATGGSGDVLAGIVTSFIGQNLPIAPAAAAASYLMGKTAEKICEKRAAASVIPTDIIENIFTF